MEIGNKIGIKIFAGSFVFESVAYWDGFLKILMMKILTIQVLGTYKDRKLVPGVL